MASDPRQVLEQLCTERGENFASLSRLIGRNETYIQQYLRKGSPRTLRDRERRMLARYFQVSEIVLGGLPEDPIAEFGALVPVARVSVRTSAGSCTTPDEQSARPYIAFDPAWLRSLTGSSGAHLSVMRVEGDSMAPTLSAGDDILIDLADAHDRLRDGIYALRAGGTLVVKRLAVHPVGRRATVQLDNPAYGEPTDCALGEIDCFGRVIWAGRKIA